jgi:hypothetical protein
MNAFRSLCLLALVGLLAALSPAAAPPPADKDSKAAKKARDKDKDQQKDDPDLGDVNAEVTALQVVYYLQLTPAQVAALAKLAPKTAAEAPPRKVIKASADFRKNLRALRDALAKSEPDDDRLEELYDALDKLRTRESPEFDEVELTDEARKHAPDLFRTLSARQIAVYVGGVADFPDPAERLHEALEESRKRKGNDWRNYRDDIAFEVGYLIAGLDAAAEEKVRRAVTALLNSAQRLDAKEFKKEKADLDKQAKALAARVGSLDVIRHYVQRVLAELLSNHRLGAALQRRQGKAP